MTNRQIWPSRLDVTLVVVLTLFLAACSPPAGQSGTSAPDPNPACDLITPEIAAQAEPELVRVGQAGPARPPGTDAYLCT